jgi:hypothetical protein
MKKITTQLGSIIASLILFSSVPLLYAWTSPSATVPPPEGNVAAPINISNASQNKLGALGLGGLAVFGKSLLTETNGYALPSATKPSMLLGVNGAIGAKEYCDEKGMNCVTTLGGGGGNGWENVPLNNNDDFNTACMYRFEMGGTGFLYPSGVYSNVLYWNISEEGTQIHYILSTDKKSQRYKVVSNFYGQTNGGTYVAPISKIEKFCGGSSSGSATGSNTSIIPGWPNKILCEGGDQKAVLYVDSVGGVGYPENRIRYSSFQDAGPHTSMHFNYSNGNYVALVGRTDAFGKAIDSCVAKGNIRNQAGFN